VDLAVGVGTGDRCCTLGERLVGAATERGDPVVHRRPERLVEAERLTVVDEGTRVDKRRHERLRVDGVAVSIVLPARGSIARRDAGVVPGIGVGGAFGVGVAFGRVSGSSASGSSVSAWTVLASSPAVSTVLASSSSASSVTASSASDPESSPAR